MKRITIVLLTFFMLFYVGATKSQNLPIDEQTGAVVYTDVIVFDTLDINLSFLRMLNYVNSMPNNYINVESDTNRLIIRFRQISGAYSKGLDEFGQIESDIVIRYLPNKFAYRVSNFKHVPKDDFPPCSNRLEVVRPLCFEGRPYENYWKGVKQSAIETMNDFILKLFYVTIENQPGIETLKMDTYFLARNRE